MGGSKGRGLRVGDDLLSRGPTPQVPSARVGLTTGFEKGPGVPPPLGSPTVRPREALTEGSVHRSGTSKQCGNSNFSASRRISPRPLVPVRSTHYCACTAGLSNGWSTRGLTWLSSEEAHLEARFPLRCFQRLSGPQVATRLCHGRDNRHSSAVSTPVLSY